MDRDFYSVAEAAKILKLTTGRVRQLAPEDRGSYTIVFSASESHRIAVSGPARAVLVS